MPKILVKRGLDAARLNIVPDLGEIIWSTDAKRLYIGDGVAAGGIPVVSDTYKNVKSNWNEVDSNSDAYIDNKPAIPSTFTVVNDLTTGGTTDALSAEQGKVLDGKVQSNANNITLNTTALSTLDSEVKANTTKLNGIESGAQKNVQSDWSQADSTKDDYIKNKPAKETGASILATGYTKPTTGGAIQPTDTLNVALGKLEREIDNAVAGSGEVNVQSDWNQADTSKDDFIKNKPAISSTFKVVNDLTTGGATDALSAEQGKNINTLLSTLGNDHLVSATFDNTTNELKLTAKDGTVQSVVIPDDKVTLINDLTTGGTTDALTAEQGKVLKNLIDTKSSSFVELTDTPANYTSAAGFAVYVNAAGNALEFVDTSVVDGGTF